MKRDDRKPEGRMKAVRVDVMKGGDMLKDVAQHVDDRMIVTQLNALHKTNLHVLGVVSVTVNDYRDMAVEEGDGKYFLRYTLLLNGVPIRELDFNYLKGRVGRLIADRSATIGELK